eukprot:SAG31_NODE_391_length_16344_cov_15.753339_10_plen_108_part_00
MPNIDLEQNILIDYNDTGTICGLVSFKGGGDLTFVFSILTLLPWSGARPTLRPHLSPHLATSTHCHELPAYHSSLQIETHDDTMRSTSNLSYTPCTCFVTFLDKKSL